LKVCYFGTYDNRERNTIIIKGLKENGVEVYECNVNAWGNVKDKSQVKGFLGRLIVLNRIILSYIRVVFKYFGIKEHDVVVVRYPGYIDVFIAKLLTIFSKKLVVLDAFLSLYEMLVEDRKLVHPKSIFAKLCFLIDKYSTLVADKVLLDTNSHIDYYCDVFEFKRSKFARVLVGADDSIFYPRTQNEETKKVFDVLFFGKFIPLHGISVIVEAAKMLNSEDDIKFTIIGKGQEYDKVKELADKLDVSNINWINWITYKELPKYINKADVCLGIFGDTEKADRVIPHKVFESMATGKAIITADTTAIQEVLIDKKSAILCKKANAKALADAIMLLKRDESLRRRIAQNGYETFKRMATPKKVGKQLKEVIMELI